jgi:hypothetical protein
VSDTLSDNLRQLAESAEPLVNRLAAYFMMSLLDDPAIQPRPIFSKKNRNTD